MREPKMYTNIKSKFIRDKLKKTGWKRRSEIDSLIKCERFALGKPLGLAGSYMCIALGEGRQPMLKKIYQELDPNGYEKFMQSWKDKEKKEKEEHQKLQQKWKEEEQQAKKEWLKAGGKP
ncbi:MAG: hypothetical protein V1837_06725 [Candidatus Woesearchaeota archaeon]